VAFAQRNIGSPHWTICATFFCCQRQKCWQFFKSPSGFTSRFTEGRILWREQKTKLARASSSHSALS
jgi:hypothetical protein